MKYKQPRSIQVVIFTELGDERRYLLLRRVPDHGSFWQPVTGSLEDDETPRHAAVREVFEETGLIASEDQLVDLGVTNTFEIAPRWREKYAPGVSRNEEVCFALSVAKTEPRLDPAEHDAHVWVGYEEAWGMLYWESSRRAFAAAASI